MADDAEKLSDIKRLRKLLRFQPLRFVNIFFSIILTLFGVGILLAAITVRSELSDYIPFLHYYLDKPVLVIISGSIILICVSCLGIISSAQNIYQGIVTFGVLLFGLFMFKLTMGVVFLAVLESADRSIKQALENHVNNYTEYNDSIDFIQTNLKCCGINDFTDWNSTLGYIPGSCCESDNACGFSDVLSLSEIGCYEALKDLIYLLLYYLIIILAVLAALQVTAMVITFFLARGIADYRRRISACIIVDSQIPNPEIIAKVQNPLGLRKKVKQMTGKIDQRHESNSIWNANHPVPTGRMMNHEEVTQFTTAGSVRENIFRNPSIYRDVDFSYDEISRSQKVVPSAPQLPRAHRKFPVGF